MRRMLRIGGGGGRAALFVILVTGTSFASFVFLGCGDDAPADKPTVASPLIEAGVEDAGPRCKGIKGPTPVRVGDYCIDATEVSVTHYREFLSAKFGDMSGQPPECQWNTTYAAKVDQRDPANPVYGADWCDAFMYCQWAGKRLCGLAVAGSGNVPVEARATSADEWYRACSGDDGHVFPYGDTHDERACTGSGSDAPTRVGGKSRCEGGFPGVFDMSGNLWEWESSCEEGAFRDVECAVRGGSFRTEDRGACKDVLKVRRDLAESGNDVTIRCCSDVE